MSFVFNKQIITDLLNTLTKSREEVKSFIDEILIERINAPVDKYDGSTIISALIKRYYKPDIFPRREREIMWKDSVANSLIPNVDISIAIEMLISKGADVNSRDDYGDTPLNTLLEFSKGENRYKIEKMFIDNGALLDITNKYGTTPLDISIWHARNIDELYILIKNGAINNKKDAKVHEFHNLPRQDADTIVKLIKIRTEMNIWWQLLYEGKFKIFEDKEKEYTGETKAYILKAYKRFSQHILSLMACGIPVHKMIILDFENSINMCQTISDEQLIYAGPETDFLPPHDYENWKPPQKLIKELTIKENEVKADRIRLENEKKAERLRLQELMEPNNETSLVSVPERRSKHGFDVETESEKKGFLNFLDGGYKKTKKKKNNRNSRKYRKYRKYINSRKYRKSRK